jgi:hypothetical protein
MTDGGFRVLAVGSPTWEDGHTIFRVLNEILNDKGTPFTVILPAMERGAGQILRMWCEVHPPGMITMERHRTRHSRNLLDRFAPHLVVAFLMPCAIDGCPGRGLHWSHDAFNCVNYARGRGVQVRTLETVTL